MADARNCVVGGTLATLVVCTVKYETSGKVIFLKDVK